MRIYTAILLLVFLVSFSGPANSTLWDRGGGLIYDDVLNVTWHQNVNLAKIKNFGVSGINSDGKMSWYAADQWISAMNAANYLGYSDWRLPSTPDEPYLWGYDGTTSAGYNITTSEMGYMYYVNLENIGLYAIDGTHPLPAYGLKNYGPFINLPADEYWSGVEAGIDSFGNMTWWGFSVRRWASDYKRRGRSSICMGCP